MKGHVASTRLDGDAEFQCKISCKTEKTLTTFLSIYVLAHISIRIHVEGSLRCRRLLPFWGYCGLWIPPLPYLPFPYDLLVVAFSLFLVVKARYSEVNPPENVCGTKHREKATHK